MSKISSFKIEGIELRVRQKPITETLVQSAKRELSINNAPRIFLNDDGKLYFQDNIVKTSIPLDKIENLYDRIKYEKGQLNFYVKDLTSFVPLSQLTNKSNLLVNTKSLLYSSRNFWTPDETFNGLSKIEILYKEFTDSIVLDTTNVSNISANNNAFWDSFTTDTLRHINDSSKTIFDTFLDRFVPGIISGGGFPLSGSKSDFCDDEGCTLQNLSFFIDDEHIGLSRLPSDIPGKVYLFGESLTTLDNYVFSNLYKYNGIGKFINKVFGSNKPTTTETYSNYFFEEDGYTTVIRSTPPIINSFTITASGNAQCGESFIPNLSAGNSGAHVIGDLGVGYIGIKVEDSDLTTSASASANALIPYLGCSATNTIGNVESQSGDIPITGLYTAFEIKDFISNYKVWYSDINPLDNTGSAKITTVYSPRFGDYDSGFTVDAIANAVFEETDGSLSRGKVAIDPVRFIQDTDTVVVGIFPAGTLTVTLDSGGVRYTDDTAVFFNDTISGAGTGELRTSIGKLDYLYGQEQVFTITADQEPVVIEAWYQDNDNVNNEGSVTFSYKFVPDNLLFRTAPPEIPGQGVYYNTPVFPFQELALEEISRSFSSTMFQRFVLEMHQVLLLNGYISGSIIGLGPTPSPNDDIIVYNFFPEDIYASNILTTDILEQTKQRMLDKSITIKNELHTAFQNAFSASKTNLINLSNFNQFSVGGQFNSSAFFDVDFSLFNGVWIDLDNFYAVSPKISNDSGISTLASLNVDITHRTDMRFEFRLFETVSQTELDRVMLQSFDYNPSTDIGNILNEYTETVPIQLQYIGPVPQVQCTEDIYKKCSVNSLDVKSHVKLNVSDLYSVDSPHKGFKVITDRFKELGVSAKIGQLDSSAGGTTIIDLNTPRIVRVQWRMIIDENKVKKGVHKKMISNIAFNSNTTRSDDFEISLNVYNLGNLGKQNLLSQGVVVFNNKNKQRVSIPSLTTSTGFDYSISLSCNKNINVWFEDKTGSGFTIVSEKKFKGEVSWIVNKQAIESEEDKNVKESLDDLPDCLVDFKPKYGSLSNFNIFKNEGYQLDILSENLVDSNIVSISGNTNVKNFIDSNGPKCSTDCINDCPDGWFCSSDCFNANLTPSGCACCECITDINCPSGMSCNGFGQCV